MVDAILWWTGAAVWAGAAAFLVLLVAEVVKAFIVAADLTAWSMRCVRAERLAWKWWMPLRMWLHYGLRFARDGHDCYSFRRAAGEWGGFMQGQLYAGYSPATDSSPSQET